MSILVTSMLFRKLFSALLACILLLAPALGHASMAQAALADHHSATAEKSHCEPAGDEDQDKPFDMGCCDAMCMAVAVTPAAVPLTPQLLESSMLVGSVHGFRTGTPLELATPPPRAA